MAGARRSKDDAVYAGPPAEGATPTVPVGDPPPETANLTGSGPDEPDDKTVRFSNEHGGVFTVSSEHADLFKDLGYKAAK